MKEIDETREVKVVQCPKGHLYPGNVHKTCPYCIKEAEEIAKREALKKAEEPEFHINTPAENSRLRFNKFTDILGAILSIIFAPLIILYKIVELNPYGYPSRNDIWDPHFWDKYTFR